VILSGAVFGAVEFLVSNFIGPQLTNILSSLGAIGSLVLLLKFWKPKDNFVLAGESVVPTPKQPGARGVFAAWLPYLLLAVCALLWAAPSIHASLDRLTLKFPWPGLHNAVLRMPPAVPLKSGYEARFTLNFLTASGTSCMFAVVVAAVLGGLRPRQFGKVLKDSIRQLALAFLTITSVLAMAFVMNYGGATTTLGIAFAATGRLFPFFSAMLGWLGVFLVGSDTSSNALFGDLQVVTAGRLGLDPVLMAAANSSGGVMGKMISLSSIAVAAAATGMPASDEPKLFRSTLRHSLLLAMAVGLTVALYSRLQHPAINR